MTKSAKFAAIGALVALSYPASAWFLGQRIESALDTQYAQLADQPFLKVVERDYQRGVFESTETVTFEFFGAMVEALRKAREAAPAADAAAPPISSFRLTLRTRIQHGPLPGMSTPAAGVADTELVLAPETREAIAKLFGNASPVKLHTVYRFDGGGNSRVDSPAFAFESPESGRVAWDGIHATVDFDSGLRAFRLKGEAPRFEVLDPQGTRMTLAGIRFEGDQKRLFDDQPLLLAGTQRIAVELVSVQGRDTGEPPVLLKQMSYDTEVPVKGEFIDLIGRMAAQAVEVGGENYGPAHYDVSMKHVNARAAANLYGALMKAYGDPAVLSGSAGPEALLVALAEPARELLAHDPELHLDRLSFRTPQGEASLSIGASLKGATLEEFSIPALLLPKLEARGSLQVPESLLAMLAMSRAQAQFARTSGEEGGAALSTEQQQMVSRQFEGELQQLAGQGLVKREGGMVSSQLEFKAGQLIVNGQVVQSFGAGG